MKPFLKWAGSKYQIIDRILEVLPKGDRLIEPFAGSGAVFLNTEYDAYQVCDANPDLITLYKILQAEGQEFIDFVRQFYTKDNNNQTAYYDFRVQFNETSGESNPHLRAALFVYLNRHGYNGLCRYNSKGQFNVPFGRYDKPYFPEAEMQNFYEKSQRAEFVCQDFVTTMMQAKSGDVIYCDPPYVPLSETANFTSYSTGQFGAAEQEKLAELANELSSQQIQVVISNHDTPFTQNAYKGAKIYPFPVKRYISCQAENRKPASELLAIF